MNSCSPAPHARSLRRYRGWGNRQATPCLIGWVRVLPTSRTILPTRTGPAAAAAALSLRVRHDIHRPHGCTESHPEGAKTAGDERPVCDWTGLRGSHRPVLPGGFAPRRGYIPVRHRRGRAVSSAYAPPGAAWATGSPDSAGRLARSIQTRCEHIRCRPCRRIAVPLHGAGKRSRPSHRLPGRGGLV